VCAVAKPWHLFLLLLHALVSLRGACLSPPLATRSVRISYDMSHGGYSSLSADGSSAAAAAWLAASNNLGCSSVTISARSIAHLDAAREQHMPFAPRNAALPRIAGARLLSPALIFRPCFAAPPRLRTLSSLFSSLKHACAMLTPRRQARAVTGRHGVWRMASGVGAA